MRNKLFMKPAIRYACSINKIESVQSKAATFIFENYKKESNVNEIIKGLHLDTLHLWREISTVKLINAFKQKKLNT